MQLCRRTCRLAALPQARWYGSPQAESTAPRESAPLSVDRPMPPSIYPVNAAWVPCGSGTACFPTRCISKALPMKDLMTGARSLSDLLFLDYQGIRVC